ncbi:hypothetical protein [Mycobacterium barrassiae]|uniref:hypothetical protein n=1 Tax=Mycobacterium barrassiae TaxID=319709 RepID=UPI002265C89E|nr:hypothetical protein [Mycobacterium barrassiae]
MYLAAHKVNVRNLKSRSFSQTQATKRAQRHKRGETFWRMVQSIANLSSSRNDIAGLVYIVQRTGTTVVKSADAAFDYDAVQVRATARVSFGFANPAGVVRLYDAA